ncbi:hypothetical protein JVU11DRAFT_8669 [Chiua virens]|nr:hypothetical protein JVU11DRAFT_8669 [Chiua virens]
MCRTPPEIILRIISFLGPGDVVRLSTVSKQFRDITYTPILWMTLYVNARLPRPPGPFPSQSVHFLENTLVKSERLAQSWMTWPIRCESPVDPFAVDAAIDVLPASSTKVFNNQWLVSFEAPGFFVIRDLDTKTTQTIPCSQEVHWKNHESFRWDTISVTSLEGPVIYVLFRAGPVSPWKFLEFRLGANSGTRRLYLALCLTVPTEHFSPSVILGGGHGPFLRLEDVIFHTDKRRFYKFPPFRTALNVLPPGSEHTVEPHTAHKNACHSCLSFIHLTEVGGTANVNLVQAFTLPCDASSVLRLSHEGIIHGPDNLYFPEYVNVIRNSLVDPTNGETNIRLLDQTIDYDSARFSCIDLTLLDHASTEPRVDRVETVLPITIRMHDIIRVDNLSLHWQYEWVRHLDFSDDGYVRGVGLIRPIVKRPVTVRFMVDASQEQCTATLGRLPSRWRDSLFARRLDRRRFWMDSVTGKICYTYTSKGLQWISLKDFE